VRGRIKADPSQGRCGQTIQPIDFKIGEHTYFGGHSSLGKFQPSSFEIAGEILKKPDFARGFTFFQFEKQRNVAFWTF